MQRGFNRKSFWMNANEFCKMWGTSTLDNEWVSSSKSSTMKGNKLLRLNAGSMHYVSQRACEMKCSMWFSFSAFCSPASQPLRAVLSLAHRKFVSFVLAFPKYKSLNQTKSVVQHKWSPSSVKTCGWTCGIDFSLELMGAETEAVNYWAKCFSFLARRYRSLHLACCKPSPFRTFPVTSFINYANFISLCLFSPHGTLSKINILKMHLKEFTAEVF